MPRVAVIDTGNICQLKCPLCLTGSDRYDFSNKFLTFEEFKLLLGRIGKIRILGFSFRGEPFLNPDIFKIASYAHNLNILVEIHSNFSFEKDDAFFEKIITSGIDTLSVSIDGVSQAVYETYRKGGNIELVKNNLSRLLAAKKRFQCDNPFIVWQYLYSKFNQTEISAAQHAAKTFGIRFNLLRLRAGIHMGGFDSNRGLSQNELNSYWHNTSKDCKTRKSNSKLNTLKLAMRKKYCEMLFACPYIGRDGELFPCCLLSTKESAFGNLHNSNISELWNGPKYQSARLWQIYRNKKLSTEDSICLRCPIYQ